MSAGRPKLLLRLDAGSAGLGHAVRTAGLVDLLDPHPELLLVGRGEGLAEKFPAVRRCEEVDAESFASLCRRERPDAVLVDLPRYDAEFFKNLRRAGAPIICIDDWGGDVDADLVINGTVIDGYHHYPLLSSGAVLSGGDYTLIRPQFGRTPWKDPVQPGVVVIVGSGERATEWAWRLLDIDRSGWGRTSMIVGGAFPDREEFASQAAARQIGFHHGLSGDELANRLSEATLTLITGGMVVYEAMAVGVPSVVFPQLRNLVVEAEFLSGLGCIEDLGFEGGMDPARVSASVSGLLADSGRRKQMSKRQRSLIDGRGMERAAKAISRFLQEGPR